MSRKFILTGVGVLASATLLLAGCGDDQNGGSGDSNGSGATTTAGDQTGGAGGEGSETGAPSGSGTPEGATGNPGESGAAGGGQGQVAVDEAKARQVAQDAVPGGTVENLALDQSHKPNPAWDVLATDAQGQKRRIDVDAVTGEVLKNEAATY